ncbi:MAG: methionine--tRNA ligase [Acidobacteriota bacterium]|nr:methionine--tRNA ligase [Acidobacteriota bacterium]
MASAKPKYYITTPIYYVNARPHLGHTYTTIAADAIARYKQMRGFDVLFLTGTDEHGQKVERSAKKNNESPIEFVDRVAGEYRDLWKVLGLRVDRFIRTTETRHAHAVQHLFREIENNGFVHKGHYEGNYCVYDEAYIEDSTPGANCPDCGRPTERVKEENYFFQLSKFEQPLLNYYEQHPDFIQPEARRNEVISFVRGGLRDLSISRTSLKWGIPWPGDEKHVFYVWSDALTNYITAVGYPIKKDEFSRYWPADVHLVGKEIIRFHAVYWPAFLMAAGMDLPKKIFAHGHLLFQDEKMSKSRGNIQSAQPIVGVLGAEALRYFLLREIVFGQDGSFSREALIARYNSDLANGLGNLASRTAAMIDRSFAGKIPKASEFQPQDDELAKAAQSSIAEVLAHYDKFEFSRALEVIWAVIAAADKYLTTEQPWSLGTADADQQRRATILWVTAEVLRIVTALAHPVLPESTAKVWTLLGQSGGVGSQELDSLRWGQLTPGVPLGKFQALFPRVEKAEAMERIEAMENQTSKPAGAAAPAGVSAGGTDTSAAPSGASAVGAAAGAAAGTEKIGIEDFTKVEMRVGQIQTAERIAGADKLLKLTVDIGTEVRQICAGIAQFYEPEKLVGRKVAVVVNLAPRKLRGVESNGMIVAASVGPEGRPVLAGFLEDVEVGSRLK